MTPHEKAKELFYKFQPYSDGMDMCSESAKQCALIAVDEIMIGIREFTHNPSALNKYIQVENYWLEVKQEIEKL